MTDSERRIPAPRHRVTLLIGQGESAQQLGPTRDVSLSGMFVETTLRPELGSVQPISLVWGDDMYLARAEIVRHASDGIGLKFVDPDQGFLWAVGDIITSESLGIVDDD